MRRLVQSACPCFWRATLRFLSLVTQFISTRISPAQARAKCVSVLMENAGGGHCACIFPSKVAPSLGQVSVKLSGRVLGTGTVHASCSQTCYVANTSAWCTGLVWGGCDNVTYACVTDYLLRSVTFMCT